MASRGSGEGQGSLTGLRRGSGNSNEGCRASERVKEALRGFGEGQESLAGLLRGSRKNCREEDKGGGGSGERRKTTLLLSALIPC